MSTRAAIIEKTPTGYRGIYSHWDGYPECVGKKLFTYYKTAKKVHALINLGDISSLGKQVSTRKPHTFDNPDFNTTVAYHRDRNEKLSITTGPTIKSVKSHLGHNGYVYVFENNKWTCNGQPLEELFNQ
jgi:hypothetical protein